MTDTDKTVAVFVEKENGEKVQVGWATPDQNGARRVNLFEEYNNTAIRDVKFADVTPFEATADPTENEPEVIEGELEDDADDVEDVPEEFSPAPAVQEENSEQQ